MPHRSEDRRACPNCDAPRAPGPECPRCGVIYAKARGRIAAAVPDAAAALEPAAPAAAFEMLAPDVETRWEGDLEDVRREWLIRAVAPPAALALAWLLVSSPMGHMLSRVFLSMWVHELGHAVTAWLSGFAAFPGPWRTPVSAARQPAVFLLLAAALAALAWHGWRTRRKAFMAAAAGLFVVQIVCTLLPANAARALFTFGGDAGCMVIGAALVATIWTDPEGALGRGMLRWGFLVIGAFALVDALDTWIGAWRDPGKIPLGEIEGVGLSDASKLVDVHRWTPVALSERYVGLGLACLALLAAGWTVAFVRGRARVVAAARPPEPEPSRR
jgi:hypothetical protein